MLSALLSLSDTKPNGALRRLNPVVRVGSIVLPTEATLAEKGAVGVSSFGYSGIIAHAVLSDERRPSRAKREERGEEGARR